MLWFNKTKQELFFSLSSSFLPISSFLLFILPQSTFSLSSVLLISHYFFKPSILFFIHSFFLLFISSFIFLFSFSSIIVFLPSLFTLFSSFFFLLSSLFSLFPSYLPSLQYSFLSFLSFFCSLVYLSFLFSPLFFSSLRSFHSSLFHFSPFFPPFTLFFFLPSFLQFSFTLPFFFLQHFFFYSSFFFTFLSFVPKCTSAKL